MTWFTSLYTFFSSHIFGWRDVAELLFFSGIIYYFSLWLKKDKQKNLLLYFYSYCTIIIGMHHAQLPTASFFLLVTAPAAIMLFILIHQESLQKNFVMLRSIKPAHVAHGDWVETLIRGCLIAANNNKKVHCAIEHLDSLSTVINTPLTVHAAIQQNLLSMMLESDSFDQDKFLWINTHGRLLGMNASWNSSTDEQWIDDSLKNATQWQHDALFFTQKTDAIILAINPSNRLFSIITQGKIFNDITAPHALNTIKKYITPSSHTNNQKENAYENLTKKSSHEQHSS
ncbi:MAG: hypothetical protein P4L31_04740 [Candidatus Babeliales bacterium]|nr:hypothetical protein [Candidatus Babeliales bacterium]